MPSKAQSTSIQLSIEAFAPPESDACKCDALAPRRRVGKPLTQAPVCRTCSLRRRPAMEPQPRAARQLPDGVIRNRLTVAPALRTLSKGLQPNGLGCR
jgi:hypothetical protein